jgi:hypothetical protein
MNSHDVTVTPKYLARPRRTAIAQKVKAQIAPLGEGCVA